MPTILRRNGFEFIIRTRDHESPHVHVLYAGTEVLFNLGIGDEMQTIREVRGMSRQNVRRAFEMTVENNKIFTKRWREIYR